MTRYLAIGAIFGFGLAVLLLATLGNERTTTAAVVTFDGRVDGGLVGLPLTEFPRGKDRMLFPGSALPVRERLRSPTMVPLGMQPVLRRHDAGQ
jgi:hypothetical protein